MTVHGELYGTLCVADRDNRDYRVEKSSARASNSLSRGAVESPVRPSSRSSANSTDRLRPVGQRRVGSRVSV
ncbi:hypothetical protein C9J85_19590 [Haloferax sp. wsp5]|nr:hypothetical protein C9J85_19590 [Haloferax sp. wsp5]